MQCKLNYFFVFIFVLIFSNSYCQIKVYFAFGKYQLDNASIQFLNKLSIAENVDSITVTGFTDSVGTIENNLILAQNRINTVLSNLNFVKDKVVIQKVIGETLEEKSDALNRKVEISWTIKQAPVEIVEPKTIEPKVLERITFDKIFFYPSTPIVRKESIYYLDELCEKVKKLQGKKLEIRGHINWPSSYNGLIKTTAQKELSYNRAKTVYEYIKSKNIDVTNITYRGMDNTEMVYPNATTDEEMQQNMRVEIVILE